MVSSTSSGSKTARRQNGFVNFLFDPDYARNGKFYTIHLEDPSLPGSIMPDNTNFPGLKLDGYTTTPVIVTPPSAP